MTRETKYSGDKMVGKVFGRLTILENLGVFKKQRKVKVKCECGDIYDVKLDTVISGDSKSCGCLQKEIVSKQMTTHGLSGHLLMGVHGAMIDRCYKETDSGYENYGAVGVMVCDEWKNDFISFYNWCISNGWRKGLCIDKDKLSPTKPGKLYSPEFCCFLTNKENNQYRSDNKIVEHNGESLTVSQWADRLGMKYNTMADRVRKGMTMEEIINTPVESKTVLLTHNGHTLSIKEWSEKTGIYYATLCKRVTERGWSAERALTEPTDKRFSKHYRQ